MKQLHMKPHHAPGLLLTFCGLDGCGKTTMIRRLADDLQKDGYGICLTKQPTDAVRGSGIFRTYMDQPDHERYEYRSLSLLAAGDRVQHVSKVILPELAQGKIVLCDRYFYSCLANLRARGYTEDRWIYEIGGCLIRPDVSFFFDIPVEMAVGRVRARPEERDRYIDMALQYRLAREYREICRVNGGVSVPTDIPLEETYRLVKEKVTERLGKQDEKQA